MSQPHSTDKHSLILNAAQKRFARYGLTKVTMDDIADDLGISKAALYYYFPTKEEIFRRVIAREQQGFFELLNKSNNELANATGKMMRYFRHYLDFVDQMLNLKIVSVFSMDNMHPIMRDVFREFSKKQCDIIELVLCEGKKNGEFFISSPKETASLLLHTLNGLRLHFFFKTIKLGEGKENDCSILRHEVTLFAEIFLKGISIKPD
jgi:TetR/AcrR family transcriptional regulator